jgi:hypothetical protein
MFILYALSSIIPSFSNFWSFYTNKKIKAKKKNNSFTDDTIFAVSFAYPGDKSRGWLPA